MSDAEKLTLEENWIGLYEELGSFREVQRQLKKTFGKSPTINTMTKKIKEIFKLQNIDFNIWLEKYKKKCQPNYHRKELDECVSLVYKALNNDEDYRKIGEFAENAKIAILDIVNKIKKFRNVGYNPFRQIALEKYLSANKLIHLMKLDNCNSKN